MNRVIITNGVFDVLHIGHIDFLNQLASKSHIVIVGVNSDESVRRLKGESRPYYSLEIRLKALSSLKAVSSVLSFEEDTFCTGLRCIVEEFREQDTMGVIDEICYAKSEQYMNKEFPERGVALSLGIPILYFPEKYKESSSAWLARKGVR